MASRALIRMVCLGEEAMTVAPVAASSVKGREDSCLFVRREVKYKAPSNASEL